MPRQARIPGSAPAAPVLPPEPDTAGLPNAADIDVPTLLGPVLTKQGWVCPPDRTPEELARLRERLAAKG